MTYKGIAKGRTIELSEPLPLPDGQSVQVSVEVVSPEVVWGTPAAIRQAMHRPPHVSPQAVDDFEGVLRQGRLAVREQGVFDAEVNG